MRHALIAVCGVVAAAYAAAQTPTPPPAAGPAASVATSPAKKELISKVLERQRPAFEALGNNIAAAPALQLRQQAGLALQRVPTDRREALGKELEADLRKYVEETAPLVRERATRLGPAIVGPLLEERLTEDELRQVLAIVDSAAFRKYVGLEGEIQRLLGERIVADTRAAVEPKVRVLEQSMTRRMTAAAPAGAASAPAPAPAPRRP